MGLVKRLLLSNFCFSIIESVLFIIKIFYLVIGCYYVKRVVNGSIMK